MQNKIATNFTIFIECDIIAAIFAYNTFKLQSAPIREFVVFNA